MEYTLDDIGLTETDKASHVHDYLKHYETHLKRFQHSPIELLEIGVFDGGGLRTWEKWFSAAHITGIDIAPLQYVNTSQCRTILADVNSWEPDQNFDVIIDDGSHKSADIVSGYVRLWPYLKPGGWYIIEDMGTQLATDTSFSVIDQLVREVLMYTGHENPVPEIHMYDELLFLKKA